MSKLNVVYMGTPDFATLALENLIKEYNVTAVFTQPDKPKGRGQKMQCTPIKEIAVEHGIPVYQPVKLRNDEETINMLIDLKPDFIVVAAYGQILTKKVLDIPRLGCINIHASLLPKLRGAAPINWSIIRGDKLTGITTMLMNEGIDTGDMLLKEEVEITDDDTYETLHDKLKATGARLIIDTLKRLEDGTLTPEPQDHSNFTYAPMLKKELGHIDWNESCENIHNLIRGIRPWPCAFTYYNDRLFKIWTTEYLVADINETPGKILEVSKQGISVACKNGKIIIKELQELGGKRLPVSVYLNGHPLETNIILS